MQKIDLTQPGTLVMGILNLTPDSFSDGGKYNALSTALERALEIESEGAHLLDIGGESTRPGSEAVSLEEELNRVIPVIENLQGKLSIPISVDTTKAEVARQALEAGASLINDISAFQYEPEIAEVTVRYDAWCCLMHMQGKPRTMQASPFYENVVEEVKSFLLAAAEKAMAAGVAKDKIILDPGIGFGKSVEHNFILQARLSELLELGYPILMGLSRKSFIGKSLNLPVEERMEASLAAAVVSAWNGAKIVRVHDVKETVRAIAMADKLREYRGRQC
jgi:dihydropteroate synthase